MITSQVELRESCGKVAGARGLKVVPEVSMVCLACCGRARFPWLSQASRLVYSSHMPLYGTVWLVEYGTMWCHGSSPTKLSCGGVAGKLREQGIWPPVHGFSKLVYWGFAARPFGRQARDRRQFKNHGFSVAGTHFLCKTMCFLLREQKGLPVTVKKPWFFCCGKNGCFKNDEVYDISCKK